MNYLLQILIEFLLSFGSSFLGRLTQLLFCFFDRYCLVCARKRNFRTEKEPACSTRPMEVLHKQDRYVSICVPRRHSAVHEKVYPQDFCNHLCVVPRPKGLVGHRYTKCLAKSTPATYRGVLPRRTMDFFITVVERAIFQWHASIQ